MTKMDPGALRALCLENDHLAVPLRPGITITFTDDETGRVLATGKLQAKGRDATQAPPPPGPPALKAVS